MRFQPYVKGFEYMGVKESQVTGSSDCTFDPKRTSTADTRLRKEQSRPDLVPSRLLMATCEDENDDPEFRIARLRNTSLGIPTLTVARKPRYPIGMDTSCWTAADVDQFKHFLTGNRNQLRPNPERLRLLLDYARTPQRTAVTRQQRKAKFDVTTSWTIIEDELYRKPDSKYASPRRLVSVEAAWAIYTTEHIAAEHAPPNTLRASHPTRRYYGWQETESNWFKSRCRICAGGYWQLDLLDFSSTPSGQGGKYTHVLQVTTFPLGQIALLPLEGGDADILADSLAVVLQFWRPPPIMSSDGSDVFEDSLVLVRERFGIMIAHEKFDAITIDRIKSRQRPEIRSAINSRMEKGGENPQWHRHLSSITLTVNPKALQESVRRRSKPDGGKDLQTTQDPPDTDSAVADIAEFCDIGLSISKDIIIYNHHVRLPDYVCPDYRFAAGIAYVYKKSQSTDDACNFFESLKQTFPLSSPGSTDRWTLENLCKDLLVGRETAAINLLECVYEAFPRDCTIDDPSDRGLAVANRTNLADKSKVFVVEYEPLCSDHSGFSQCAPLDVDIDALKGYLRLPQDETQLLISCDDHTWQTLNSESHDAMVAAATAREDRERAFRVSIRPTTEAASSRIQHFRDGLV